MIGWLRKLLTPEHELEARSILQESLQVGATRVADCASGGTFLVRGVLQSVILRPKKASRGVEAELFDGSGYLRVVWMGRRAIAGIEAGRPITVSGRIVTGHDGHLTMFNPRYELAPRKQ